MARTTTQANVPVLVDMQGAGHTGAGDHFDFQAQLTSEPAAAEGRHVGDCESKVYLQTRLLNDGKTFDDFAVDPNNPNADEAITFTAIALAESGGNSRAHNPQGEDSLGLWQINVAQTDNDPDSFDCSELVEWAGVATETLTIAHEGLWLV